MLQCVLQCVDDIFGDSVAMCCSALMMAVVIALQCVAVCVAAR